MCRPFYDRISHRIRALKAGVGTAVILKLRYKKNLSHHDANFYTRVAFNYLNLTRYFYSMEFICQKRFTRERCFDFVPYSRTQISIYLFAI